MASPYQRVIDSNAAMSAYYMDLITTWSQGYIENLTHMDNILKIENSYNRLNRDMKVFTYTVISCCRGGDIKVVFKLTVSGTSDFTVSTK